ncbi:MAG: hypothetical protein V7K53_07655 [Nostoc sp.]|uniref:hypothetical protein n=1 Tax=Nostoc sp. TaxID=1180 RepID=UPI002FF7C340
MVTVTLTAVATAIATTLWTKAQEKNTKAVVRNKVVVFTKLVRSLPTQLVWLRMLIHW